MTNNSDLTLVLPPGGETAAAELIRSLRDEIAVLKARMATIAEMLLDEARRRDWCAEYDEWVQNVNDTIGANVLLSMREEYSVHFSGVMNLEALSEDDATEKCSAELYRLGPHSHFNVHSIEIGDSEVAG